MSASKIIFLIAVFLFFAGCGRSEPEVTSEPEEVAVSEKELTEPEEEPESEENEPAGDAGQGVQIPAYVTIDGEEYSTALTELDLSSRDLGNDDIQNLRYMVNLTELWLGENQISDITPITGLVNLTRLHLGRNQISDITPLAGLTNLEWLHLGENQISDIAPVAGLTDLSSLFLNENQISDLTPITGLVNLTGLSLADNQISDITPIAGLVNLTGLSLDENQISDITPIAGLVNLLNLWLGNNPITDWSPVDHIHVEGRPETTEVLEAAETVEVVEVTETTEVVEAVTEIPTDEVEESLVVTTTAPVRGTWAGNVFTSTYLGLQFELTGGWINASDIDMAGFGGMGFDMFGDLVGEIDEEIPAEMLEQMQTIINDMMVANMQTGSLALIIYQPADGMTSGADFIETVMDISRNLGMGGFSQGEDIVLGRYTWENFSSRIGFFGFNISFAYLINIHEDYLRVIAIVHNADNANDVLAMFRPI